MIEVFLKFLLLVSLLTNLTVQAIKKILEEKKIKYSANILAMGISITLSIAISVCYAIYFCIDINSQFFIFTIALCYLSFLTSTLGYDKIIQTLKQIGGD